MIIYDGTSLKMSHSVYFKLFSLLFIYHYFNFYSTFQFWFFLMVAFLQETLTAVCSVQIGQWQTEETAL